MHELSDRQRQALAIGLDAFDAACRVRRRRRRAVQGLAVAVAMGAAIMFSRGARTLPVGLPEYVQIITDDPQLAAELALANACERFERTEGRLVVVECTLPGSAGPRW